MKTAINLQTTAQEPVTLNTNAQWLLRLAERIERLPGIDDNGASQRMRAAVAVSTRRSAPGEIIYEKLRLVTAH